MIDWRKIRDLRHHLPLEPRILIAVGALMGLLSAFGAIAEDVLEGENQSIDTAILLLMRSPSDLGTPVGPAWLLSMFRDITSLGSPTVITLVTVIAWLFLALAGRLRLALLMVASVVSASVVETLMKLVFDRPRPDLVPHLVDVPPLSFPSGHAMLSAMAYLSLGALLTPALNRRRLRIMVLGTSMFLVGMIGISRVYLGVHWPTDVMAGWSIGAAWALLFWFVARRLG